MCTIFLIGKTHTLTFIFRVFFNADAICKKASYHKIVTGKTTWFEFSFKCLNYSTCIRLAVLFYMCRICIVRLSGFFLWKNIVKIYYFFFFKSALMLENGLYFRWQLHLINFWNCKDEAKTQQIYLQTAVKEYVL